MAIDRGERCMAIGVVPKQPFVLWDYDLDEVEILHRLGVVEALEHLAEHLIPGTQHRHWCIRETKNGYHLVVQTDTWDESQNALYYLHDLTHKQSIMSCRRQRIRVSPKWSLTGVELSFTPRVIRGCLHKSEYWNEIKGGHLEFYWTYERGIDTGIESKTGFFTRSADNK